MVVFHTSGSEAPLFSPESTYFQDRKTPRYPAPLLAASGRWFAPAPSQGAKILRPRQQVSSFHVSAIRLIFRSTKVCLLLSLTPVTDRRMDKLSWNFGVSAALDDHLVGYHFRSDLDLYMQSPQVEAVVYNQSTYNVDHTDRSRRSLPFPPPKHQMWPPLPRESLT